MQTLGIVMLMFGTIIVTAAVTIGVMSWSTTSTEKKYWGNFPDDL